MGIAERKEREKRQMKSAILEAAMKLFLELGPEKTSIRKIAQSIEYSPATIYLYFQDKNEILYELHILAFTHFRDEIGRAGLISEPFERLRFLGRYYIDFALKNPEKYDLMFIMRSPMDHLDHKEDDTWEVGGSVFHLLEGTVKECLEKGRIRPGDSRGIAYSLWAYVHGVCSLAIRDRMAMYEEDDLQIVLDSYDYFLDCMKV